MSDKLFWSSVKTGKRKDCWEWQGSLFSNGYGQVRRRKYPKMLLAHRYSLFLCGKLADLFSEEKVLHKCDNPRCVNPFHLFIGTLQDNVDDMRKKGRGYNIPAQPGEKNPRAKLSWDDVRKIREIARNSSKVCYSKIARQYGVSHTNIRAIISCETWKE